ncbi:protein EI24 homolog isoform X2 [Momordica charantia]|uniref:Protein EI24 homolog isoform X2 n=1 Tax=Momordica charantia TaxID=3673 RepID=A0A6J1DEU7_MOMCH|nr:protein EI24 homolog isoform X2 [Momordica charantia]
MEAPEPLIKVLGEKLKRASRLWLDGFLEACCLHRVVILCRRSKKLLTRTGQCFLLNGFIFLGSLLILNSVVIPTLQWILPDQHSMINSHQLGVFGGTLKLYSFLRLGLIHLFYLFWFYPLYIFSFILSNIWYNDIARHGFAAMGQSEPIVVDPVSSNTAQTERSIGLGKVVIGIGEQLYSLLLINSFFLEVYATGLLPFVGKALNFLLLSWMYKWNLSEVSLDRRLDYFESNWAFFAGFGSPCVLAIFFFSPLVSYGVMAILFPLFVLTATGSVAENDIYSQRTTWKCAGLGRLPIFYAADTLSMKLLTLFPRESQEKTQKNKEL